MKHGIEILGPNDSAKLNALMAVFGRCFDDLDRYCGHSPGHTYQTKLLSNPNFIAIIACDKGNVLGGLTAYELPKPEKELAEIYIYDLAVDEAFRRQGIASALIEALKTIGLNRGAEVIFVQADYGDDPAIALYTKLGSREDVMHFDIKVN
jgi:aminoglycoside 3-N-acetyltransferase I